jgi:hypothetical protein
VLVAPQGRRAALRAIDLDVLTTAWIRRHRKPQVSKFQSFGFRVFSFGGGTPSPLVYESKGVAGAIRAKS